MDAIQTLIVGIINIINQLLGLILVIYSAIISTFFGGISVAVTAEDNISAGCLTFLCVSMVMTVVLYMLLIIFAVLGSAMAIMGEVFQKVSVIFLMVSEVLIIFVIGLNVASIIFSSMYMDTLVNGPYYFSYFYILNYVTVTYLLYKFVFQMVYIIGIFPSLKDVSPKKEKMSCIM